MKKEIEQTEVDGLMYYNWVLTLKMTKLKNRKSIYDWVRTGKLIEIKIGSSSFYRQNHEK